MEVSNGDKTFLPGDFNNDGFTDLIVAEEQYGRIIIFTNNGSGTLQRTAEYPVGTEPSWLTSLDFNKDGIADLGIANHEADTLTLLQGSGDARFDRVEPSRLPIETDPHSHMIASADLNADGVDDLILDSRDQYGIYVLRGKANGTFDAPGTGIDAGGAPYHGFAVGDLNNDGLPDIVTPNQNDLGILLNRSEAAISFEKAGSLTIQSPFAVDSADINGDGNIDIVAASLPEAPGVVVFGGDGTGGFRPITSVSMSAGAKMIATGDTNSDGLADAVITSWNTSILLLIGHKDQPYSVQLPTEGIRNPWGVALADFNNDGNDEVIVADAASSRIHIYSIVFPNK